MENKFLSWFDSDNLRKTMLYLAIAILLIIASLFCGFTKGNSFAVILFFIGCVLFFYGALHPWGKPFYYLVLVVISIIIFLLLCFVGVDLLVKMYNHGKEAEDIAWLIGGVCIAAFIAGIIGAFRFRK
jgi:hypothetical protein